jgi:acyl-CoA thioester hydrolase
MIIALKIYFRVSYSDTDQMGFMHHSNYLKYYETARWELFRSIGMPYYKIEGEGIIFPVTDISVKYIKPAYYDQEITVDTAIKSLTGARMIFNFLATNENGETINEAQITVASVRKSNKKACPMPKSIFNRLKELMNNQWKE